MSAVDDPKANRPVFMIDKDFGEAAVRLSSPLWSLPDLSDKQKAFLCMTSDVCRAWLGLPFLLHTKMAQRQGAKRYELKELVLFIAPYASFPLALSAMIRLKIFTWWQGWRERREKITPPPLAMELNIIELLPASLSPVLAEHFKKTILPLWQRPGLSLEDKILMTIACDVSHQTLGESFRFHLQLAKKANVPMEKVRQTIFFVSEYAFSKAWTAMAVLKEQGW